MHQQLLSLTALAATAAAAAITPSSSTTNTNANTTLYDAIIVGGGPSGLSALSALARVRRNVLLLDSAQYRNDPTRHQHDVLGYDGVTPAYYRWAAREQISHYETVGMQNGTVARIEEGSKDEWGRGRFVVYTSGEGEGEVVEYEARKIVLATGLRDILPDVPGIEDAWGKGIFWCPWCDGTEHADQALGLLGDLESLPGMAREMLTLNTDLYAFANGTDTPAARDAAEAEFPGWQEFMSLHNVTVDNRTIASLTRLQDGGAEPADPSLPTHPEYDLFRVDFESGESPVERAAFLASWPDEQRSDVGSDMGVELWGGRLAVDASEGLVTNIPGVYAVGDANSENVTNVPHALFSGKRAAVYLHVELATEDAEAEIAENDGGEEGDAVARRGEGIDLRAVWEEMNGDKRDLLYAGEFEQ